MSTYAEPVLYNDQGQRVRDAQYLLHHNRFGTDFHPGPVDGIWGKQAMAAADRARWLLGFPADVCKTGRFGQELFDYLRTDMKRRLLPPSYRARRLKRVAAERTQQIPALPNRVWFPDAWYPATRYAHGLQPWIVPQVEAICHRFGLTVTAGHGGHPPHARYSDHAWGGAVDLAGSLDSMVKCTFWADGLASGFYRNGKVFRWVGGPAHDGNGIEHGHYSHVHLSWFRRGPATTVFGTAGFAQ